MRSDMTAVHGRLLRLLTAQLESDPQLAHWMSAQDAALPGLVIESFDSAPWASLTFTGERHRLEVRLDGRPDEVEAAQDRIEALIEAPTFDLGRHCLIELALTASDAELRDDGTMRLALTLEALTIED